MDWHGEVVEAQRLVDVKLGFCDLLRGSSGLAENSEFEDAIIDICDRIAVSLRVLLHLLQSDKTRGRTTNLFIECLGIRLQIVHPHPVFAIILFRYRDGPGRIITDHARNDGVQGWNLLMFSQI